ncbi:MAG: aminotransferase class V-fold PLP-dependent enzyme [Candidatus Hodarchaeota archaeon]
MNMKTINEEFPTARRLAFFQASAISLLPHRAIEVMQSLTKAWRVDRDPEAMKRIMEFTDPCRSAGAKLIGAKVDEITYTSSTTAGVNIFASSLPWRQGDNIVVADLEYPSNVFPWYNQAQLHRLNMKVVRSESGQVPLEKYQEAIDRKTKAVAVSHVQYISGFRHDLSALSQIAHDNGAYLFVDGIQSLGALKIDVKELGVDAFASSGYKWLCAPMGTGLLYTREDLIEELAPVHVGIESIPKSLRETLWERIMTGLPLLDDKDYNIFCPSARRFQYGMPNLVGAAGLEASVNLFLELGPERIEQHIKQITNYLVDGLEAKEITLITPKEWEMRAGIVTFKHTRPIRSENEAKELEKYFAENDVLLTIRGGCIRVACHLYNTKDDIDKLLRLLPVA